MLCVVAQISCVSLIVLTYITYSRNIFHYGELSMAASIDDILYFWFGDLPTPYTVDGRKFNMWFKNGAAYDHEISVNFGVDYAMAISGKLNHWVSSSRGRLALIIILDQFSRHIHRGSAMSFAQDTKAQQLCIDGINAGDDICLHPIECSFYYLPLEHAEDIEIQNLSVKAYTRMLSDIPAHYKKSYEMNLEFARRHQFVIEKFGRFPELNEILGRKNTADEISFIANGEYSFL